MLTESNKCLIYKYNLVGNIMLMISPSLNWIEPILSSAKQENVLVLLKYQDPFIERAIVESAYLAAFLFGLSISALFNGLWISTPLPIQAMAFLRITSL